MKIGIFITIGINIFLLLVLAVTLTIAFNFEVLNKTQILNESWFSSNENESVTSEYELDFSLVNNFSYLTEDSKENLTQSNFINSSTELFKVLSASSSNKTRNLIYGGGNQTAIKEDEGFLKNLSGLYESRRTSSEVCDKDIYLPLLKTCNNRKIKKKLNEILSNWKSCTPYMKSNDCFLIIHIILDYIDRCISDKKIKKELKLLYDDFWENLKCYITPSNYELKKLDKKIELSFNEKVENCCNIYELKILIDNEIPLYSNDTYILSSKQKSVILMKTNELINQHLGNITAYETFVEDSIHLFNNMEIVENPPKFLMNESSNIVTDFPCTLTNIANYMNKRFFKRNGKWLVGFEEAFDINWEMQKLQTRNPEYHLSFLRKDNDFILRRAIIYMCLKMRIFGFYPKETDYYQELYESFIKNEKFYCDWAQNIVNEQMFMSMYK